jgi:hypothetical protein
MVPLRVLRIPRANVFYVVLCFGRCLSGPGYLGLRFASELPEDGSPSGPANPSRNFYYVKHQTALAGCRGKAFF